MVHLVCEFAQLLLNMPKHVFLAVELTSDDGLAVHTDSLGQRLRSLRNTRVTTDAALLALARVPDTHAEKIT
jgi:hypothetical protein